MSYLNYNIVKTVNLLLEEFKNTLFISILISIILFGIIVYFNKDKKIMKYIIITINVIIILFTMYFYLVDIFKFNYLNPFKNIYIYLLNSIIYFIIISIFNKRVLTCKVDLVLYLINLINIIYVMFMTIYLKNIVIIVIGNIFPQIYLGNILLLVSYLYMIINRFLTKKK